MIKYQIPRGAQLKKRDRDIAILHITNPELSPREMGEILGLTASQVANNKSKNALSGPRGSWMAWKIIERTNPGGLE